MATVDEVAIWAVTKWVKGDLDPLYERLGRHMKANLSREQLTEMYERMTAVTGKGLKRGPIEHDRMGKVDVAKIEVKFEKADFVIAVGVDEHGYIAFMAPAPKVVPHMPPPYVTAGSFSEVSVTVGADPWALPGTLTLPKKKVKHGHPCVVLVHGSGPNDRDETLGGHKPFLDLAWGLASHGIASVRYEKRTRQHNMAVRETLITLREETIDDAIAAVSLARGQEKVNESKVVVAGHSLGAYAGPTIAAEAKADGLIMLAAPARSSEELIVEQLRYLAGQDPKLAPNVAEVEEAVKRLAAGEDATLMGVPAAYWSGLRDFDPLVAIESYDGPVLVLQGGRDYQVTMQDFDAWKTALAGRRNAKFESFPALNHAFALGVGPSLPAEYQESGNVDEEVVKTIAGWVGAL